MFSALLLSSTGTLVSTGTAALYSLDLDLVGNPPGAGSTASVDNVQVTTQTVSEAFTVTALAGPFSSPAGIASGDVDGDGHPDLVATDSGLGKLLVYNGDGTGQFTRSDVNVSSFGSGASAAIQMASACSRPCARPRRPRPSAG